jgi:hypothetical protein
MAVARLRPSVRKARTHSKMQIRQIAGCIARFGFTNPILIDSDNAVIAGCLKNGDRKIRKEGTNIFWLTGQTEN